MAEIGFDAANIDKRQHFKKYIMINKMNCMICNRPTKIIPIFNAITHNMVSLEINIRLDY